MTNFFAEKMQPRKYNEEWKKQSEDITSENGAKSALVSGIANSVQRKFDGRIKLMQTL